MFLENLTRKQMERRQWKPTPLSNPKKQADLDSFITMLKIYAASQEFWEEKG